MLDKRGAHIRQHPLAMRRISVELSAALHVSHRVVSSKSKVPTCRGLVLGRAGRLILPAANGHPKMETA